MALRCIVTVTASHDRDPSCNDYTLTQEFVHGTAQWTDGVRETKEACRKVIANFLETYPHRGRSPRPPVIDVTVQEFVNVSR